MSILGMKDVYLRWLNAEDALSEANYPTSTNYIDAGPFEKFGFIILAGGLDTQSTFQVKQDTSATETASIKNVTNAVAIVSATGDDKISVIEVSTANLDAANDFRYVTLNVAGPTGNDYAAIAFYGLPKNNIPPTQHSSVTQIVVVGG